MERFCSFVKVVFHYLKAILNHDTVITFDKIMNMRVIAIIVIIALLGMVAWLWVPKLFNNEVVTPKETVSKYSPVFNQSLSQMMDAYDSLTNFFVQWDSASIERSATALQIKLTAIKMDEHNKDSILFDSSATYLQLAKSDLGAMVSETDFTAQRHILNGLTKNLFHFFESIRYDASKLFLQECTMAFNDTGQGLWLSRSPEIRNPYLGLHHPRYKKGMLKCGETKQTLNFTDQNE